MENMKTIDAKSENGDSGAGKHHSVKPPSLVTRQAVRSAGLMETCDVQGLLQLSFHFAVLGMCAAAVRWCYSNDYWMLLLLVQVPFGVAESFLFNGFHEMVHNTAFKTQALNTVFAELLGFTMFRGAKWFWCFHWTHHRYTNDPAKDPELSGGSLDLDDPTSSAASYAAFLSGYPFGFERIPRMFRLATGMRAADPWVADQSASTRKYVRIESAIYCIGYLLVALAGVTHPRSIGINIVLYWLLPHCFGAGHLRMYQFAEHRACLMGPYTDTNAWICSRTTSTWWFYRKLAWQMPWHVEHHAFPNVPFHKLQATHEMIKAAYVKEGLKDAPSGCNPDGKGGYLGLHAKIFNLMVKNVAAKAA